MVEIYMNWYKTSIDKTALLLAQFSDLEFRALTGSEVALSQLLVW